MAEHEGMTVLLLARAGEARQRLESALAQAGARLLRAVDPAEGDPDELLALRPGAVLVALEPAIEDALERHDALLADPSVLVVFDEAEVAAQRDGWDAARWARHLAAKLHGHGDVLPPGAESEDAAHPAPGALPERDFDPASLDMGALAEAAQDLAADVPRAFAAAEDADGDADDSDGDASGDAESGVTIDGFVGLVSAEDMDWSSPSDSREAPLSDDPDLAELLASAAGAESEGLVLEGAPALGDDDAAVSGNAWTLDENGDIVFDGADADVDAMPGTDPDSASPEADAAADRPDPLSLGDGLSLADDDAPAAPPAPRDDAIDLEAMDARLEGLSLADPDSYGHGVLRGAVVVEAGLGGPDAVRQLLGGLGEEFARAVLVRLQLDGGRYDRLVQQMQRATPLPVELASAGGRAEGGTVYFLPPGVTVGEDRARLVFASAAGAAGDEYAALPAGDSALVFLSGADPERVGRAMDLAGAGALVLAQAPDTCYDATAVVALVARGAVAAEPGDLAQALLDHWH